MIPPSSWRYPAAGNAGNAGNAGKDSAVTLALLPSRWQGWQ